MPTNRCGSGRTAGPPQRALHGIEVVVEDDDRVFISRCVYGRLVYTKTRRPV